MYNFIATVRFYVDYLGLVFLLNSTATFAELFVKILYKLFLSTLFLHKILV